MSNKEYYLLYNKQYYNANIEYFTEYRGKNAEHYRQWRKDNRKNHNKYRCYKYQNEVEYRVKDSMRHGIRRSLGSRKDGSWTKYVNYTLTELMNHLEKQFKDGMSWDNYGQWHIDHIIPIAQFEFESYHDLDFKLCWSLINLQPLWAI